MSTEIYDKITTNIYLASSDFLFFCYVCVSNIIVRFLFLPHHCDKCLLNSLKMSCKMNQMHKHLSTHTTYKFKSSGRNTYVVRNYLNFIAPHRHFISKYTGTPIYAEYKWLWNLFNWNLCFNFIEHYLRANFFVLNVSNTNGMVSSVWYISLWFSLFMCIYTFIIETFGFDKKSILTMKINECRRNIRSYCPIFLSEFHMEISLPCWIHNYNRGTWHRNIDIHSKFWIDRIWRQRVDVYMVK